MSSLADRALELALSDAPATGDAELDAAVDRARADIDSITAGLALLAGQAPPAPAAQRARRSRRLVPLLAAAAAVVLVAFGAGWLALRGGGSPQGPVAYGPLTATPQQPPQYERNTYDYAPLAPVTELGLNYAAPYTTPRLRSLAVSSSTNAWAVGVGVAWRWDGAAWRSTPAPRIPYVNDLTAVSTTGPADAWMVGARGRTGKIVNTVPVIERWNGNAWRSIKLPLSQPAGLTAVSAVSPTDVWVGGWWLPPGSHSRDTRGFVAHWDGARWHITQLAAAVPTSVTHVVATSASDAWLVEDRALTVGTTVRHWDGAHWRTVRPPFGPRDPVIGFTATSANDAWAVGGERTPRGSRLLSAHWNGHTWQIAHAPSPYTHSGFLAVSAIAPDDVWALAWGDNIKVTHPKPNETDIRDARPIALFEHWNGVRWSLTDAPRLDLSGYSSDIAAAADGSVWALGSCQIATTLTRWDGHAWVTVPHPGARPAGSNRCVVIAPTP